MSDSIQLDATHVIALRAAATPTYVTAHGPAAQMAAIGSASAQQGSTFMVRPGLAGQGVSFESLHRPGHFLRHANFVVGLHADDGSSLFAQDASFIQRAVDGGLALESVNFPGAFVHPFSRAVRLAEPASPEAIAFVAEHGPVPIQANTCAGVRRFALILGADEYLDPALENLGGCRNDVIDAAVTLIQSGLVDADDVKPVASPTVMPIELSMRMARWGEDPAAHLHRFQGIHSHNMRPCFLRWAIDELRGRMDAARARGETPMLFLFWSGHGGLIDGQLAFRLPGIQPGEDLRAHPGLPAHIRALPDAEFNRIDISYAELIDLLGLRKDESVFAVIGSCHAGAVLEGVAGADRPADMIFTAGGIDTTLRERPLGGRLRGLLNWSILRALEQFSLDEDGTLQAGMDLSFGQLLQTVRAMTLALQGNTATAWLPQVHGALRARPEVLAHRVGQVFTASAGETASAASNLGGDVEWPIDTTGYDVKENGTLLGTICVSSANQLRLDAAVHAAFFASTLPTLDLYARSTMPSPLGTKVLTSGPLSAPASVSTIVADCFKMTSSGSVVGYLLPDVSGKLTWYVLDVSQHLQAVKSEMYLKSSIDLVLSPTTKVPGDTYRTAVDDPV